MLIEYVTGQDSFSATQGYKDRSVSLGALVYNNKSGTFQNPRNLTNGCDVARINKVHKAVISTTVLGGNPGTWYHYRPNVKANSLWLFELRTKQDGPFIFETEYFLFRFNPDGSLFRVTIELPDHPYANVKQIDLIWQGEHIKTHKDITVNQRFAVKKVVGETHDYVVDAIADDDSLPSWNMEELQKPKKKATKVVRDKSGRAKSVVRARRVKL